MEPFAPPDSTGSVLYSFMANLTVQAHFDDALRFKDRLLVSLTSYYMLNLYRMLACNSDVRLVYKDHTHFIEPNCFRLMERVALRPALDVLHFEKGDHEVSFRARLVLPMFCVYLEPVGG